MAAAEATAVVMKPNAASVAKCVLLVLVSATLTAPLRAAAPTPKDAPSTNAPVADVPIPLSVFDDLPNGRDPFFPNSKRRMPKTPVVVTNQQPVVVERVSKSQFLTLSGISGVGDRRLALINNRPFKAGETGEIRIPTGSVRVECVEIREKSVLIQIEGENDRKELRLRENPVGAGPK